MGVFIIATSIVFYAIGNNYVTDSRMVALIVILVAMTLLVIAFVITHSFENLAEANRMKTEFVNIVSHQLRAPLTNLRWATQFLLSEDFQAAAQDEKNDYFDIIKENGNRMEGLIDDLLTITRLKEGKPDSRKVPFNLAPLIQEIIDEHGVFAQAKNIDVSLSAPKDVPQVLASHPLIKIVVENLVGNAINYSRGGKEILIKLETKKERLVFSIEDHGIGIPSEDKRYVFEKFFRAKNAVQTDVNGTGLGLFIVKMILDGMSGRIWFKTKENRGTTFYFSLPIVKKQLKTKT